MENQSSWYVVTGRDRAVSHELERWMAHRMGATIVEIQASHLVPVSHAQAIASVIDHAAKALSGKE